MNNPAKHYHHGDLKAAILKRAAEVIEAQGIEALTLRGIARDLSVSHGAPNRHFKTKSDLLAALATDGWEQITRATLRAAEHVQPQTPRHRLNAMGRGFLSWALTNKSAFIAVTHPDVERHADAALKQAIQAFQVTIREAVMAAQQVGRNADTNLAALTLFTNSVPFGAAMLILNPWSKPVGESADMEKLIGNIIDLVVPIEDVT
jgi:AcrR family transcriptional regulator